MRMNPALAEGRTAVITGAANGIGLAAAKAFARLGMKVCLADLPGERLQNAEAEVVREAEGWAERVRAIPTDVSRLEDVQRLREAAYAAFGEVAVLMNNAGTGGGGGPWEHYDRWRRLMEVNLWGMIIWCADVHTSDDRAGHAWRYRQHGLEARHHDAAWRHGLQREQGRGEGADGSRGA